MHAQSYCYNAADRNVLKTTSTRFGTIKSCIRMAAEMKHTHILAQPHAPTHKRVRTNIHTHTHTHTYTHSLSHTHTHTLSLSLSLTHTHIHTLSLSHIHTLSL